MPVQTAEQSSDQIDDTPARRAERTSRSPPGPWRTTSTVLPPDPPPVPAGPLPDPPPPVPGSAVPEPSEPPPAEPPDAPPPAGAGLDPPEPAASTYSSASWSPGLRPSGANTATE